MKDIKTNNTALKKLEEEIKGINDGIVKMQQDIEKLDFWKVAFSPKGIRSVLLDGFCNEFNNIINPYLATVTNGMMSIIMSPTAQTKKDEERNKLGMMIKKDGRDRTYKSLSGGWKKRVDASLCFALNAYVSKKYGLKIGILGLIILDEVFGFIDKVGEEAIATLIYNEARDKAIIEISHTPELKSYCDRIWTVVMENGVSRLEAA
jgi:DNA repair exonuclease SbcCD ATPase subunit